MTPALASTPNSVAELSPFQIKSSRAVTEPTKVADFASSAPSLESRQVADWVLSTADNHDLPFVIVDKKQTQVFVFDAEGRLMGTTSALLGSARGDDSAPGIGDRKLTDIRPEERTTAAGRFVAGLGPAVGDDDVLWVDYKAALALHRVLSSKSRQRRLQGPASVSPLDHRVTFGCINVPVKFFDLVIHPMFKGTTGIVYVLPETKSVAEVFFRAS